MSKLLKKHRQRLVGGCAALLLGFGAILGAVTLFSGASNIDVHIGNVEELLAFRTEVNAGNNYAGMVVALSEHINLAGEQWESIGDVPTNAFAGTFDGQNYKITNMVGNGGLFGYVTGIIKNVEIASGSISSTSQQTGAIANYVKGGRLDNCSVGAMVSSRAGHAENLYLGGVAGYASGTTIESCTTLPNVLISGNRNSTAAGVGVQGGLACVGGIVGRADGSSTISNSKNQATVRGVRGGNAGQSVNDYLSGSAPANGGSSYTSGVAAYVESINTVLANNTNTGKISGGMGGNGSNDGRQGDSLVSSTGGHSYTAGISNNSGNLLNNNNTGEIFGGRGGNGGRGGDSLVSESDVPEGSCSFGGNGGDSGTAGIATGGTVTNCFNQGDVTGSEGGNGGEHGTVAETHGGQTGYNGNASVAGILSRINTHQVVQNCYNAGTISGFGAIGAIAAFGSTVNCFTLEGKGTGAGGALVAARDGSVFDNNGGVSPSMSYLSNLLNEWIKGDDIPTPPTGFAYARWAGEELPNFISGSGNYANKNAAFALMQLADKLRDEDYESDVYYTIANVTAFINYIDNTIAPIIDEPVTQHFIDSLVANATEQLNRITPAQLAESAFVQVSAGGNHSLAIDAEGQLWAWGSNEFGQLGNGTTVNSHVPALVENFIGTKIISVAAGENFSMALDANGAVWTWGVNTFGQLGDSSIVNETVPSKLAAGMFNGKKVATISAGKQHALAVNSAGELFAWGDNGNGQLGTGDTMSRPAPTFITRNISGRKITAIAAGASHSLAITENGFILAWGLNTNGQLGNGGTNQKNTPTLISSARFDDKKVVAISAGLAHSMAINEDGKLYTWGLNINSQLGDGTMAQKLTPLHIEFNSKIVAISAGRSHSLAIDEDGFLWSWGHNANGRLGEGTKTVHSTPVRVNIANSIGDKAVSVSAGFDHSMLIDATGRVWSWGSNRFGRIGDDTTIDRFVPTLVFESFPKPALNTSAAEAYLELAKFLQGSDDHEYKNVTAFLEYINAVLKPLLEDASLTQSQLDFAVENASKILQLEPKKITRTITININGEIATKTYTVGEEIPEAPAIPTVEGCMFKGWYNSSTFESNSYLFADLIFWDSFVAELHEDITIYARLLEFPVITFMNDGAAESTISIDPESDLSDYTLPTLTSDYREFKAWILQESLSGWHSQIIDESNLEDFLKYVLFLSVDVHLYAEWTPNVWISFETNGGNEIDAVRVPQSGNLADYAPETPVRAGYEFRGWFIQDTFQNVFYFSHGQIMPTSDATLYARWLPKQYVITYDFNSGYHTNPKLTSGVATYDMNYSFAVPLREHYDFAGWFSRDGKIQYTDNAGNSGLLVWKLAEDVTLRAMWDKKTYEMRFDTGIDDAPIIVVEQKFGDLVPANQLPQNPVRDFAIFQGWYTQPNGKGMAFDPTYLGMPGGGITLYAYWVSNAARLNQLVEGLQEFRAATGSQALQDAIIAADAVLENEQATISEIEQAFENLQVAATDLGVSLTPPPPKGPTPPSQDLDVWIITALFISLFGFGAIVIAIINGFAKAKRV